MQVSTQCKQSTGNSIETHMEAWPTLGWLQLKVNKYGGVRAAIFRLKHKSKSTAETTVEPL